MTWNTRCPLFDSTIGAGQYLKTNTANNKILGTSSLIPNSLSADPSLSELGTYGEGYAWYNSTDNMARYWNGLGTIDFGGPFVTPEMYGAKGDGVTDDTTAIQNALNTGRHVYIPDNTYLFSNITLTVAGTTLQGAGWGSVLQSSLAATGETPSAILIQANNVTVKDFKLTYTNMPSALVESGSWVITNNGIGVGVDPLVSNAYYSNVTIDHIWLLGGKTHGICIGRNINTTVKNCRIENIWGTGIWNTYPRQTRIIDNYITETEDAGIDLTSNGTLVADPPWVDGYDAVVSGNLLYRVMSGISTHGIDNTTITNNIINTTYSYPITAVEDAGNGHTRPGKVIITGNQIIKPWQLYGAGETHANDVITTVGVGAVFGNIYANSDDELIISSNIIHDDSGLTGSYTGIFASAKSLVISGNSLDIDGNVGLRIGPYALVLSLTPSVYNLSVTGNTITIDSGNGNMMIFLNDVAKGVISGNDFDCGGQGQVDPLGRFVVTNYAENVLITGNKVSNNTGVGYVDLAGSSKIRMKGNYGVYDLPIQGYTYKADTAPTLTIAEILGGIVYGTPTAPRNYQLPTGTLADASGYFALYDTWTWSIINLGAQVITLTVNTDHTIVGNAVVAAATSAGFRTQKTADNTFITFRTH